MTSNSETVDISGPISLPENGNKPDSIVIFLHGYGSNGDDLIGLAPNWRAILPNTIFLSPNAPERTPMTANGHQWFPLSTLAKEERESGVYKAAPTLNAYIDKILAEYGLSEDRLALVGFSQGTMMALHVALRREKQIAAVLGYSGALAAPHKLVAECVTKPPVMLIHGDSDDVIPFPAMYEAVGALETMGLRVEKHISQNTPHGISPDGLQKGGIFLTRAFG
jgi:phospholipase/carboxylesterase